MIQCKDCEYFRDTGGGVVLTCDPFSTIKEPECLAKWQILRLDQLESYVRGTIAYYNRLAPMQEKMFKVIEREMDDISEADQWKVDDEEDDDASDAW